MRASSQHIVAYNTIVMVQLIRSDSHNVHPCRNKAGSMRNMGKEGSTNQKVA